MGQIKYTPADSTINTLNGKMRMEPWYQEWFQQRGLDPNRVKLDDRQQKDLEQTMAANGYQLPEGIHVDPAGNWNTKHGWAGLPAVTKAAIVTLAAVGTAGAAGAFGGGAGGAETATTSAAASGGGSSAATLPTLASTTYGGSAVAAPTLTGASTVGGTVGSTAATTGGRSILSRIGNAVTGGGSTQDRIGQLLSMGADAAGRGAQAAGNNRAERGSDAARAAALNITGESNFQNQQLAQAREEAAQRDEARKNLYRASYMKNPQVSVENPRGAPTFSPEMMEGLSNLEKQALQRTADEPQYTSAKMRAPRFEPLNPEDLQGGEPGTLETIGTWLAPGLKIADIGRRFF